MSSGPGTRITGTFDRGARTVGGIVIRVEESVWNGTGGRSFDVYRDSDGACLTTEGSFDEMPGDELLAQLVGDFLSAAVVEFWACRGCGTAYSTSDADMIVRHVQQCGKVDGAGNPVAS
jgi:hypothetical protein